MVPLESGTRISGRFQLQERIGDGGHAEIWAAWDSLKQQRVALKFLHPDLCGTNEAVTVLGHEAQMAQRLTHPGVLRAGDPLRDGQRIFLPMEYAAGGDLKRLRGASYLQTVPVLIDVARILAHAHEQGVVHRDIKPGNVLFDAEEKVRLADFGASALCGSSLSLAPGSPFTASPQQLAGEPAAPADDIYGLGALAYELLSGYPPYYPDFDPERVQTHMPPDVQPVRPAPPRLTQLVMQMLARSPEDRPRSMEAVTEVLEEALADTLDVERDGVRLISESPPPYWAVEPRESSRRYLRPQHLGIAALAAMGLIIVLFGVLAARDTSLRIGGIQIRPPAPLVALFSGSQETAPRAVPAARDDASPDASPTGPLAAATPGLPAPASASDAETAAADAEALARAQFDREIDAGRLALTRGQSALARAAFERARLLQPRAAEVVQGIDAVERLERVLEQHSQGLRAETAGQLSLARERFAQALLTDPAFAPAREGKSRVEARLAERERAEAQRLSDAERAQQNARDQRVGAELEAAERWRDAETLYLTVSDRDATLAFAREGLERSRQRAAFSDQLEDFIERSARLADPGVRRAAEQALEAGRGITPAGPKLTAQLERLGTLLPAYEAVARVEIVSDGSTSVRITRLGDLGSFARRHVELPPGRYVVVGTRPGYRDVRRELNIAPGQRSASLTVECSEPI